MTLESLRLGSNGELLSDKDSAVEFKRRLMEAKDALRGLGPTTRAALGLPVKPEEETMVGRSNGGLMRCALLGLAFADHKTRRNYVRALTEATHAHPRAVEAALVGSRLISDAVALGAAASIADAVFDESPNFADEIMGFEPTSEGVTLDPIETLGAAIAACASAQSTNEAFKLACGFGGDTDTTAALAGALFTARHPVGNGFANIAWLNVVEWAEIPQLDAVAASLATLRLDK
jgi:ADP-ribosylglycohydrolase